MEPLARAHLAAKRGGANDWLTLQKEADKLADQLTKRKMKPKEALALQDQLLDCLSVIRVRLLYCEAGLDWEAGSEGFAHYLAAMPNGLHADEAYWNTRVEPRGCGDFEPFVEAYLEGDPTLRDLPAAVSLESPQAARCRGTWSVPRRSGRGTRSRTVRRRFLGVGSLRKRLRPRDG